MDIHQVIASVVEEVLDGVKAANKELDGKARVGEPSSIEIEFGVTSTYEVANYDDVRVAVARFKVPVFSGKHESPAISAVVADEKEDKKPEKKTGSKK